MAISDRTQQDFDMLSMTALAGELGVIEAVVNGEARPVFVRIEDKGQDGVSFYPLALAILPTDKLIPPEGVSNVEKDEADGEA